MENTIQSDLIRGHIDTIILKALFDGDRYGYDIVREIEQKSSGQYKLKQPTLYSCLKRLEVKGLVRAYWGAKSSGGRRKYFTLTEMGRELFIKNQSEWEYSRTIIDKLISDREFDLNAAVAQSDSLADNDEAFNASLEEEAFEDESEESEELAENATQSPNSPVNDFVSDEPFHPSQDEEDQFQEEQSVAPEVAADDTPPHEFADTTAIMNELLRRESAVDASYTEKLMAEKVTADRTQETFTSETYFNDFYDDSGEPEPEPQQETAPAQPPATPERPDPKPSRSDTEFLDYHSSTVVTQNESIIEREYRNILGDFVNASFDPSTPRPPLQAPESPQSPAYVGDAEVDRKLTQLTDNVREMGDNVLIRAHDNKSAKAYSNAYHYYANKLGLVHYGILFGLFILEILFTAVLVHPILHAGSSTDKWFYPVATVLAVLFPVIAFIRYSREPEKRKRVNYSLKFSLISRLIIMVQCLVIVYLVNVMAGMPASFSKEYLSTLLLPALACAVIPISTLVFHALFHSRRFAVE